MKKTNAMRMLERAGIEYQLVGYQYDANDLDVAKIAEENGFELSEIFKTLVLKGDKTGVFAVAVPGDKQLDLKAAAKASGNKKARLLPIHELDKHTGYVRGGCSPIGMKRPYPVLIDQAAEKMGRLFVNAGARGWLVGLSPYDLFAVTKGLPGRFCQ